MSLGRLPPAIRLLTALSSAAVVDPVLVRADVNDLGAARQQHPEGAQIGELLGEDDIPGVDEDVEDGLDRAAGAAAQEYRVDVRGEAAVRAQELGDEAAHPLVALGRRVGGELPPVAGDGLPQCVHQPFVGRGVRVAVGYREDVPGVRLETGMGLHLGRKVTGEELFVSHLTWTPISVFLFGRGRGSQAVVRTTPGRGGGAIARSSLKAADGSSGPSGRCASPPR